MYYVYILSNWNDSVLYIGVTNDLARRLYEHRNRLADGFTKKYNVNKLFILSIPVIFGVRLSVKSNSKAGRALKRTR